MIWRVNPATAWEASLDGAKVYVTSVHRPEILVLSDWGAAAWTSLPLSLDELVAHVVEETGEQEVTVRQPLETFLNDLRGRGLVERDD